ncbi:gluconate 2-dehydrogenase subunit 3 family protein [Alteribacillus iranensis]|uniref:Gluconate 2-dehydrogenase gamma chain n=1 Tax=Alteribacillus iranensis TaxID=930128 RepID=A0A1I2BJY0_9BACI|nr:gluconate 2-dehydrogenase subunit 3 family protein [Alteribacillus iranensis]SFE56466.1 gluconate 2-dehydrogenase gamma chain [Alteribacillus iranensis]
MADEKHESKTITRRDFIKKTGYVTGGVVGGGVLGGLLGSEVWNTTTDPEVAPEELQQHDQALQYFKSRADFQVLSSATERIFPADELGPGAIELGVPYYIDHQLAGRWGINDREYRQGPFYKGEPNQGYQTHLKHHEIFDLGIEALEKYSQSTFNERFAELEGKQQDEVLMAFDNDEVDMSVISSSLFFELLRTMTFEGVYADPLYGGNKDMQGWKMKEYPGVQMSYTEEIESEDFVEMDPVSLHKRFNT